MSINWITVSAQIVNFLILVWLLKRFLYQPVMQAMEQREQRITERLTETREREQLAEASAREYREKCQDIEHRREDILAAAHKEAEDKTRQMLEDGRRQASEARENWQRQVEQEKAEFIDHLRQEASRTIQSIASTALTDLADSGLETQIINHFISQLRSLDDDTRSDLMKDARQIEVVSTFRLDAAARERLTQSIHKHLNANSEVAYSQSSNLICGIELINSGRQLSWNVADYMERLAERIDESFKLTQPIEQSA